MESVSLLVLLLLLIALAVGAACCRAGPQHRGPSVSPSAGPRERYGPPPGMVRALSHYELGDRGWPSYPWEYDANTASAISHMIERSA